ncbi:MAG: alanine racemase [Candidatus Omnitrophica bacterium]|nr:alanine racemase [Candidatus Omnitrophota bacterium]
MTTKTYRPTWAEINLKHVRHNLNEIKKFVPKDVEIMPVVKANAYGHGIVEVSKELIKCGIARLGVATVDEALKLRENGVKTPVLVLGSTLEDEAQIAVKNNITLTLCDERLLEDLVSVTRRLKKKAIVHVKIDTGMGRLGVWYEEALELIKKVHAEKNIELEGVYTHFSSAARDAMYTEMQINNFDHVLKGMERKGIEVKYRHAANSIATVDWGRMQFNLVRPGIMLYGIYPKESFRETLDLAPLMTLKTKIVFLKDTPPGRALSYGRTFITQANTKIATIPIGYADGYGRILSNKGEALVRGVLARVVGIVTMDQTLLDVGHIPDVKVGDEVVLIGKQKNSVISAEAISKLAKTIPYEILVGLGERVPRVYM